MIGQLSGVIAESIAINRAIYVFVVSAGTVKRRVCSLDVLRMLGRTAAGASCKQHALMCKQE